MAEPTGVDAPQRHRWIPALVGIGVPWLVYLAVVLAGYDGSPFLRGDGYYYVSTAISLWQDHDLDLSNQLPGELHLHRFHFSRDRSGRAVPKHPILLPVVSVPFLLFGDRGPLLFNLLQLMLVALLLYPLARRVADPWIAALAVSLTGCATILPHYAWNYSGDLLSVLLVMAGLLALLVAWEQPNARWLAWLAGFGLGLAGVAKLPHLIGLAGAIVLTRKRSLQVLIGLGALLPLGLFAGLNQHLFGAPWINSYSQIADVRDGEWVVRSVGEFFDQPMALGVWNQLADPERGLATTSPITLLSLLLLPLLWSDHRRLVLWVATVTVVLILFYSRYSLWDVSDYGNRFLLLPMTLGVIGLAGGMQWVWRRLDH